jgi:hypothetical protein
MHLQICERTRTSTTLWIKQKSALQLPAELGELWRTATNGEGGIRTHEGITPTRFRVVRDQPDSATSPHALRRPISLKADEPGTCSMLQKPTALGYGRLKPQPGSGDQLPGF